MTLISRQLMPFVLVMTFAATASADETGDFFERSVRPLLVAKCIECHGDDDPEAGLRLTSRANLIKGGQSGPAVIEKQAADSLLVQAVHQRGKLKMPPEEKLGDSEIASLTKWVELGVPWPESQVIGKSKADFAITDADRQHWSFRPVTDPAVPAVKDAAWARTSIDRFVLARYEAAGLHPAAAADRRSLIRRVYQDLIGLPPTWDDVQAFVDDPAPTTTAFEKVVDRLLQSPRYGERWGRHWLDVARFADTKDGVLMYGDDRIRPFAYTYRDYVIRAFNEDTPFDQFIREQLAADLIEPKVEPWRLGAMGFLTLGRMFDNNIHDVIDDQIDTVSRGFLGLTVACARCHDHKYDPVSTADYYSLYGVFASSEVPLELPLAGVPAAGEATEFETQYGAKREEVRTFRDQQFNELTETSRQRVGDYLVHVATTRPDPLETAIFFLSLAPEDLRPPVIARWRRFLDRPEIADDPVFGPWHLLLEGDVKHPNLEPERVARAKSLWENRAPGTAPGQINPLVREALSTATLVSRADVGRVYGELLKRTYEEEKTRPVSAELGSVDDPRQQLIDLLVGRDSPLYFPRSQTRRYMSRQQTDQFGGKLQELDRMAVKSPHVTPRAMVLNDAESTYDSRIFVRGNPTQPGRRVPRQFLEILAGSDRQPFGAGSGRLDLARAIASSQNPLTARVMVNRVWMYHFGEPLVSTPSDFGKRSTLPVHAELLDHLASQFMRDGWSLKTLHRRILLSATWQQSTTDRETGDAERGLAPRAQRLSFEAMRDTLLAISGRLEQRDGGRPSDINDPQSRCRTIYGLVDRQSLPGMFRAFDFASPDQSVERRPRTMVPQQALFALNSPFVIEQARGLSARAEAAAKEQRVTQATALYRIVFTREPTAEELAACDEFLAVPPDPGSALLRWEQLAQVLLCSNELMYVD
ncbi:MAG: PSD1 domain-containing protein [Planctomycetes bacterium]|nr:PSD1 domain-containing protein [Planctomycetota bacterium]